MVNSVAVTQLMERQGSKTHCKNHTKPLMTGVASTSNKFFSAFLAGLSIVAVYF